MTNKIKYIITAGFVGAILFWALLQWLNRNNYVESEYFIHYFPFAHRSSALENPTPYLKKLKLEQVDVSGNKATAIRLPIDCQLDYYLKIPKDAALKIFLKHYGRKRIKALEEVKLSIREEDKPIVPLHSIKFPKGIIKNQWKTVQVSLNQHSDKIVRLSFSAIRYGGASKHPEGFLFRPLLLINNRLLRTQKDKTPSVRLEMSAEKLRQTNVVLIILDAARPDHFSCYGYHRSTTPYMDQLAQEAVLFKNAYSVASYTIASTSSLFTSLYPDTHRVLDWEQKIPKRMTTLAEILAQQDYATYASGFIIGWAAQGFKESFDLFIHTNKDFKDCLHRFLSKNFADKKAAAPAFIYIHLRPPHADYDPPAEFDKWSAPDKRSKYADLIKGATLRELDKKRDSINREQLQFLIDKYDGNLLWGDWLVHQILEAFKKYRLIENSLIILTSDHGEAFLEHGKLMHNSTVYNEMIKIPLIIKFPSYIKPPKNVIRANVEIIDLMPTILDFLQIELTNFNPQGKSLLPLIFSNAHQVKTYLFARPVFDWIFNFRDNQYKYIQVGRRGELYNLQNDPQEESNLASTKPILLNYYRSLALFYRQQLLKAHAEKPEEVKLDEETKAKLRSLGYLK